MRALVSLMLWITTASAQQLTIEAPHSGETPTFEQPILIRVGGDPSLTAHTIAVTDSCGIEQVWHLASEERQISFKPLQPGTATIRASAFTTEGSRVDAGPTIVTFVFPATQVTGLELNPPVLVFPHTGKRIVPEIRVTTATASYSLCALKGLSATMNPVKAGIISVDAEGGLVADAPGSTILAVASGSKRVEIPLVVRGSIKGDLDNDGDVDTLDLQWITAALNTAAVGRSDARDLNNDGRIDVLDSRILTTICTRARCAP